MKTITLLFLVFSAQLGFANQKVMLDGEAVYLKISPPNSVSPCMDTIELVRTKDTPRKVRINVIFAFGSFQPAKLLRAIGVTAGAELGLSENGETVKGRILDGPLFLTVGKINLRFVNAPALEDGQTESFVVKIRQDKISSFKLFTDVISQPEGYAARHINAIGPSKKHLKFFYK
ncbi:MAG: hypothetical protein HYW48_09590 [Deltaproteobacteria bacterium]|nr:hypothetical protein [Deltaproteobacteria bacterium]